MKKNLILIALIVIGITIRFSAVAKESKDFDVGGMIIEHITDAHEWHIAKNIVLPLPVILIDQGKPVIFMSSKFEHGTQVYRGYKLETEGEHKGKITRIEKDGTIKEIFLDFSITKNVAFLFLVCIILCVALIYVARQYKKRNGVPRGFQHIVEILIEFIKDQIAIPSIGEKRYKKFLNYLLTIFSFIFLANLLGQIPFFPFGVNLTGSIAVTGVLAVTTFFVTAFSSNKAYWKHMINMPGVPWWLKFPIPLMPIIEISGMFIKPFVLMVRLFANITAGHSIALALVGLIFVFGKMSIYVGYGVSIGTILFSVFMGLLELLVAFIQAYVFTLLSALYFGMAKEENHVTTVEV